MAILLAIGSTILFSVVITADRLLLAKYLPNAKSLVFLIGLVQFLMGLAIAIAQPWNSTLSLATLSIGLLSGIAWGLSIITLMYGVSRLEVSRVIPLASTFPVFVALLAAPLLREGFSITQYLAILLTVIGAGLLARSGMRASEGDRRKTELNTYLIILLGSLLTAIAHVTFKYAVPEIEFWDLFILRSLCCSIIWSTWGLHSNLLQEIRNVFSTKTGLSLFMVVECVIAPIAILLMVGALALGPASIAATLFATRPLFVLAISGLLSTRYWNILNEPFSRDVLPEKLLFTTMIVAGVAGVLL